MNNTTTIKDMAATLTQEQVEAFWPLVSSKAIVSELYAVNAITGIYDDVTPDDVRDLTRVLIKQFEDDTCECVSQLREALMSRTQTVQFLIRFRVGNYAEFSFIKKYLPKQTLQKLAWNAVTNQINNNK
jgi:hypothetical protein